MTHLSNKKTFSFLSQFIILSVVVLVLLLTLTFFIFNTYNTTKKNSLIIQSFQNLEVLDTKLDEIFKNKLTLQNYDISVYLVLEFEKILNILKNNQIDTTKLEYIFENKNIQLQHFKSANSVAINSKIYLYEIWQELNKQVSTMALNYNEAKTMENISNILSIIGTSNILDPLVQSRLQNLVSQISVQKDQISDELLKLFITHCNMIINQINTLSYF